MQVDITALFVQQYGARTGGDVNGVYTWPDARDDDPRPEIARDRTRSLEITCMYVCMYVPTGPRSSAALGTRR